MSNEIEESPVLTIKEFCALYKISPAAFYKLQERKLGPDVVKIAGKRLIARKAAEAWLEKMARESAKSDLHKQNAA
jgi:hypothetical protein